MIWHPEQKLWNRPLVTAIASALSAAPRLGRGLCELVVFIDSVLLVGRVIARRVRLLRGQPFFTADLGTAQDVVFVDCGVHEEGLEIRALHSWFGRKYRLSTLAFEAGSRQYQCARRSLADVPNLQLHHAALVGPSHSGATATFYNWAFLPNGEGDSLFSSRGDCCETVPAVRLSELLRAFCGRHRGPIILRMNIEGAEWFVLDDLISSGWHQRIDGYHGAWDDLDFIDAAAANDFRALKHRHGIAPITFNGRDLLYGLRRAAIRVDVQTSIRYGMWRQMPGRERPSPPHVERSH